MATKIVAAEQMATPEFLASQNFEALLSDGDIKELDALAEAFGRNRRLAYAVMAKSKSDLLARTKDPAEAANVYLEILAGVEEYQKHLGDLKEQAENAELRILSILATLDLKIQGSA